MEREPVSFNSQVCTGTKKIVSIVIKKDIIQTYYSNNAMLSSMRRGRRNMRENNHRKLTSGQ